MVINEKALISCMKEAYRNQGYTVAVDYDNWMLINGGYWMAKIAEEETSNELRSLITLHMRQVPDAGDAYKTVKTKNGPFVQKMLLEDAMGVQNVLQKKLMENGNTAARMKRAPMVLRNCGVWQNEKDLSIMLADPRYEAMIDRPLDVIRAGNGLYLSDDISCLWVLAMNDNEYQDKIEHLAKIRWVGE
jgi:hypothetical protein